MANLSLRRDNGDQDSGGSIALSDASSTPVLAEASATLVTSQALGDKVLAKALQVQENLQKKGGQAVSKVQSEVQTQVSALRDATKTGRESIDESILASEIALEEAHQSSRATRVKVEAGFNELIEADAAWLSDLQDRAAIQQAQTTSTFNLLAKQITGTKMTLDELLADFE